MPVAPKKAASSLMKHIMARVKPMPKLKAKSGKKLSARSGRRGIEANNKIKFGTYHRYY